MTKVNWHCKGFLGYKNSQSIEKEVSLLMKAFGNVEAERAWKNLVMFAQVTIHTYKKGNKIIQEIK